jgi:cell division protein FtsQ
MGRVLLVCLAMSALAGLKIGWDRLKKSPDFKIARIEVIGNKRVSEEEILYLAKIKPGMGIFDFRMGSVVKAVEGHPWVKKAQVSRELPNQVVIKVWEEQPAAIVINQAPYYMDADFRVFKKLIPGDDTGFPIITGAALEKIEARDDATISMLQNAMLVWKLASQSKLFPAEKIAELHIAPGVGLSAITSQGPMVAFGGENLEDKFKKLERVRVEMGDQFFMLKGLDLSQPERVVARFYKKEAEPVAQMETNGQEPAQAEIR